MSFLVHDLFDLFANHFEPLYFTFIHSAGYFLQAVNYQGIYLRQFFMGDFHKEYARNQEPLSGFTTGLLCNWSGSGWTYKPAALTISFACMQMKLSLLSLAVWREVQHISSCYATSSSSSSWSQHTGTDSTDCHRQHCRGCNSEIFPSVRNSGHVNTNVSQTGVAAAVRYSPSGNFHHRLPPKKERDKKKEVWMHPWWCLTFTDMAVGEEKLMQRAAQSSDT